MRFGKKLLGLVLLGLFSFGSIRAQAEPPKAKLAVLDLRPQGVKEDVAKLLTSTVAKQLQSYGLFQVLSRQDIVYMLSHEQDMKLLGCDSSDCYAELGGKIGTSYLVAGNVGLVGKKFVINLQRINIADTKVEKRVDRQFSGSLEQLLEEVRTASHQVVADLLKASSGQLLVTTTEEGADVAIDGETVGTSPLGRLSLPAGPHDVKVKKEGFIAWARTVKVLPHETGVVDVTLIPSADFIQSYEDKADSMRTWAWITAATFVALEGAALGLRVFTWQKYDPIVDDYNDGTYGVYETQDNYYDHYKDDIKTANALDYAALGMGLAGVAVGAVSMYLFIEGENPSRYRRFSGVKSKSSPLPDGAAFAPLPGGGSLAMRWEF